MNEEIEEFYSRGKELFNKGEYQEAERLLSAVLKVYPHYADVHNKLGIIHHMKGDLRKAIDYFEHALLLNPKYTECSLNLAITLNEMGSFDKAQEVFLKAAQIASPEPHNIDPFVKGRISNEHAKLGSLYHDIGLYNEAIEEYKRLLLVNPNDAQAHYNLGFAYGVRGDFLEGIDEFKIASSLEQENFASMCSFNIAGIYLKKALQAYEDDRLEAAQDNFRAAGQFFKQTSNVLPEFPIPKDFGEICLSMGNMDMNDLQRKPFELVFSVDQNYPPDSCFFMSEDNLEGKVVYKFTGKTPPPMFLYHSPTVYTIIGLNYALRENYDNADYFFKIALEKISSDLANGQWPLTKMIVQPRKESVSPGREKANGAMVLLLQKKYDAARALAQEALIQEPNDVIAANVLTATKQYSPR